MPEIRLSGVQKPCSLRAGNTEKRPAPRAAERGRNLLVERFSRFVKSRNGARRSRFQSSGAARGRAALTRAGTRGVGRAAVEDRPGLDAGKGPGRAEPGVAVSGDVPKAASPRKTAAGQRFSEERRRCRCREAAKKNARTPGCCNDARILPERARPGANGRRARTFSPAAPRRKKFPKTRGAEGPGSLRCAKNTAAEAPRRALARASGRGSPPPRNCRNARRKAPERGTKKSGRTPPPATESGRAPSVKTTQMRTT